MSKGGSNKVRETEAERALAEIAKERLADYKGRWAPLVARAAEMTKSMGADDSFERRQMAEKTTAATRSAFTDANEQVEAANANRGIRADSAKAKLGTVAMGNTEAASLGVGLTKADQAIDDAYVQGLASLVQMGRGEAAEAVSNQGAVAQDAARQAQSDAQYAAQKNAGNAELLGTAIGIGAYGKQQPKKDFGGVPGLTTSMGPKHGPNTVGMYP